MTEDKTDRVEWKDGVKYQWDKRGMCFVSVHFGNAPLPQWEEWNSACGQGYSGQRWQMLWGLPFFKPPAASRWITA